VAEAECHGRWPVVEHDGSSNDRQEAERGNRSLLPPSSCSVWAPSVLDGAAQIQDGVSPLVNDLFKLLRRNTWTCESPVSEALLTPITLTIKINHQNSNS
jgi:hypothetical protein